MGLEVFFVCRWISTNTKENQQCCISALALFADGEDGKFTVSSSLSAEVPV